MKQTTLVIADEFSRVPAGRTPEDGPFSGKRFREELLIPRLKTALQNDSSLVVDLGGLFAVSSSFLEEAFGGLIRANEFDPSIVSQKLTFRSSDRQLAWAAVDAKNYIEEAIAGSKNSRGRKKFF